MTKYKAGDIVSAEYFEGLPSADKRFEFIERIGDEEYKRDFFDSWGVLWRAKELTSGRVVVIPQRITELVERPKK